jgi:NitT/TauT family transport system substrate-binding protein
MKSMRWILKLLACAFCLNLVGAYGNAMAAEDKIRLLVLPFSESLGAVIAEKEGYFKDEGLNVEMKNGGSAPQMVPLLQAGQADIVLSNTVTTLQAIGQGLDATFLAPGAVARTHPPDTTQAIMVLKDAIRSPKDLKGKRVAVNVINSTAWLYTVAFFDKYGLSPNDVRYVEIPFPQMNAPLLNRQVDAITQVEPFRTVLMDTGQVKALGYPYVEVQPNADITQYIALSSWVKTHKSEAEKFARAVRKGAMFANQHVAAAREINQAFTGLNPTLKDRVLLPRFGEAVNPQEIRKTMDLMLKYGLLEQKVDLTGRMFSASQ